MKSTRRNADSMLDKLPPAYLRMAETAYGRKFASDADIIRALDEETFDKCPEFLASMTKALGFEFTSPLEVFRLASGERLAEFEPLSPPPGAPTAFEVAAKLFGRDFAIAKDLSDFIDEVPTREGEFQTALIAAGWRARKKKANRRISLEKADRLFSDFVERISEANSTRRFAFFVQEVLVYGSYMRRQKSVGDIDLAMQFAMKTEAKLNERISFYMEKTGVDWKQAYSKAIGEVSSFLTGRSKYFHDSDGATVKRSYPYRLIYSMPAQAEYVRLVNRTSNWMGVEHLHRFLETAERKRRSRRRQQLTDLSQSGGGQDDVLGDA
jgi:hypothetical protein